MQPPEAGIIICTLQMRKVRHARLSNVPKTRQLGSGGIRVWTEAVWLQRVLQTGSREQMLGVRQSFFHPESSLFTSWQFLGRASSCCRTDLGPGGQSPSGWQEGPDTCWRLRTGCCSQQGRLGSRASDLIPGPQLWEHRSDHRAGSWKFAFQVDCISISGESPFLWSALRIHSGGWSLTRAGSSWSASDFLGILWDILTFWLSLPTWAAKELIDMDETLNFQGLCDKIKVIVLLWILPLMKKG